MLLAITTEGKIGLGVAAGLLILFAIASSFWLPRRNPDFPGERLGVFVAVTLVLFVALMAAVVVFAKEEEVHAGAEGADSTQPAQTETTAGGGETGGGETGGGEAGGGETGDEGGDAAAGKDVFASAGCGGCHALEDAGASGAIGPNLDEAQPDVAITVDRVTNGRGAMPSFSDRLDEQQIRDVAAYVAEATG